VAKSSNALIVATAGNRPVVRVLRTAAGEQ
jgi:hypothetical protein